MQKTLKAIWSVIEGVLKFIGKVNSVLLLSIFYYLILGPMAIVAKFIKLFSVKKTLKSYWVKRDEARETSETLARQF